VQKIKKCPQTFRGTFLISRICRLLQIERPDEEDSYLCACGIIFWAKQTHTAADVDQPTSIAAIFIIGPIFVDSLQTDGVVKLATFNSFL
jgi:hypothetical protein